MIRSNPCADSAFKLDLSDVKRKCPPIISTHFYWRRERLEKTTESSTDIHFLVCLFNEFVFNWNVWQTVQIIQLLWLKVKRLGWILTSLPWFILQRKTHNSQCSLKKKKLIRSIPAMTLFPKTTEVMNLLPKDWQEAPHRSLQTGMFLAPRHLAFTCMKAVDHKQIMWSGRTITLRFSCHGARLSVTKMISTTPWSFFKRVLVNLPSKDGNLPIRSKFSAKYFLHTKKTYWNSFWKAAVVIWSKRSNVF